MGIIRRKKKKHNKKDDDAKIDDTTIETDLSTYMNSGKAKKKFKAYTIPSVDLAEFENDVDIETYTSKNKEYNISTIPLSYKDRVPKSKLIRKTDDKCPDCNKNLYNTKLDGIYFYCPSCKKQYHI